MFSVGTDAITAKPYIPVYFDEFAANVLLDNIGSKKSASCLRKK